MDRRVSIKDRVWIGLGSRLGLRLTDNGGVDNAGYDSGGQSRFSSNDKLPTKWYAIIHDEPNSRIARF